MRYSTLSYMRVVDKDYRVVFVEMRKMDIVEDTIFSNSLA